MTGLGAELQGSTSPYDPPLGFGIDEASGSAYGSEEVEEVRKAEETRGPPPIRRGALNMFECQLDWSD